MSPVGVLDFRFWWSEITIATMHAISNSKGAYCFLSIGLAYCINVNSMIFYKDEKKPVDLLHGHIKVLA